MKLVNDKLVVGGPEKGQVAQVVKFQKLVFDPSEFHCKEGETDEEYGERVKIMVYEIDRLLASWSGRGEGVEKERKVCLGIEGVLNMGIDLAMRQLSRPKPPSVKVNRQAAINYLLTLMSTNKALAEEFTAGAKGMDEVADRMIAKLGSQIPGVTVL